MMEIPAGKDCRECPFCAEDSEYDPTCRMFEDPPDTKDYGYTRDMHVELSYRDDGPNRCPACLTAYPNGATVTITAKVGAEPKG